MKRIKPKTIKKLSLILALCAIIINYLGILNGNSLLTSFALMVGAIALIVAFMFYRCPYCRKLLNYKNHETCPHCGQRVN